MAGSSKKSNDIWYMFAGIALISVIGLFSGGTMTSMQFANAPSGATPLNNAIEFLRAFGFFNVILPFLLVFAIVFGVLEKSKIFGEEKVGKEVYPRKNLNAIVAFSIAFFVVSAANVVGVLQATIPQIALVLVIIISFLLLFGAMLGEEKWNLWEKSPHLRHIFIVLIFVALVLIFLGAFGVLGDIWNYLAIGFSGTLVTSLALIILVVLAMWFVARKPKAKERGE